tara:strand:- start:606 stop:1568 length:963 start_codon:yes stop_codon:yes gene_type:complete
MNEFDIIKNYFQKLAKNNTAALNLNDDVFFDKKKGLVISIDTYNEGIHYINLKNPYLVTKKIIRSAISDLFCKGVKPKYIFLSGSGNRIHFNKKNLKLIYKAIYEDQKKFNLKLSGGDTVTSKKSSFTLVVLGFSNKIIKRNGAKNNDDIYVTGNLGDSFIGLNVLKKKISINNKLNNYFIKKYYLPDLPIKFYKFLKNVSNSSIDISDGLFADLTKLINSQKLGFAVNADLIPVSKNLNLYLKKNKKMSLNFISRGDDYQILFTSSKKNRSRIQKLSKRINQKISLIGTITNQSKQFKIFSGGELIKTSNYKGYLHNFA